MITEPDVTFTDYGLAIECALFTYLLHRQGSLQRQLKTWFMLFFMSVGVGALAGGTVHGFFLNEATAGYAVLWPTTLLAIGMTALATWAIGAKIHFSTATARWITIVAAAGFVGYCVVVLFVTQDFFVVIVNYLPAVFFLLLVFLDLYLKTRARLVLFGLVGLALILVASWVQHSGIALDPIYLNHNAFYHLIQAVALFLIFWSARWFVVT